MQENNNQKAGEEIVSKLKKKFIQLTEKNIMNSHYIAESKENYAKAKKEKNQLFVEVYAEEIKTYAESFAKNVQELNLISFQLGMLDERQIATKESGEKVLGYTFQLN